MCGAFLGAWAGAGLTDASSTTENVLDMMAISRLSMTTYLRGSAWGVVRSAWSGVRCAE